MHDNRVEDIGNEGEGCIRCVYPRVLPATTLTVEDAGYAPVRVPAMGFGPLELQQVVHPATYTRFRAVIGYS